MFTILHPPTIVPPFYPARPVNGGPLPIALPKSGRWTLEGKYNGWRAWVHNPTGAMFNRDLEPLSINREFEPALELLRAMPWEWSDVEALERRHNIGRGSLILLDYLPEKPDEIYTDRKNYIHLCAGIMPGRGSAPGGIEVHKGLDKPIANNRVYLPMTWTMSGGNLPPGIPSPLPSDGSGEAQGEVRDLDNWDFSRPSALQLWDILQLCNKALGRVPFWEGLVAKRNDSIYPRQRRNAGLEFPFWMKHRWAF